MFWQGVGPKMVESASKGAVLLFAKDEIKTACLKGGMSGPLSGVVAGAGGGICQVSVMGPCTFLVTAMVTNTGASLSIFEHSDCVQTEFSTFQGLRSAP